MFQQRGKDHITHIRKMAVEISAENDFTVPFEVCITEAFKRHREEMIKLDIEIRKADPYYGRNKSRYADTSKIPIPPHIGIPMRAIPAPIQMSALNDY